MENNTNKFEILNQFIKDLSFEAPSSPKIFFDKLEKTPNIQTQLEVKAIKSGDNLYEINLHVVLKNATEKEVLFLLEISYSAMVVVNPELLKENENEVLIRKVTPYLYPFVREIVLNLTKDSGFPPFIMNAINFDNMKIENNNPVK